MCSRHILTRRWWGVARPKYALVISETVEIECERGAPEMVAVHRGLLQEAPLFPLDQEILELARVSLLPALIPKGLAPDRVHIAAVSVAKCDFLLKWNFRHIANVRIGFAVR